ncbi:MAG TPA: MFS transporter [Candidatus Binataceae bacterium]|nr:MFS transporter [Candidatus Binataceae bacterium]
MTQRERQGWIIVASLWATLFIVFGGGYNAAGIFITPLLKTFPWSRAQVSTLQGGLALTAGLCAPLVGWLLDRIEARVVMVAGAITSAGAYLVAANAHSYSLMLAAYLILGLGVGAATFLPASLVIANWFGARRGAAMGAGFSGSALGGTVMILVGAWAISHFGGWRAGYVTLAAPMVVVIVPLLLIVVRSHPPEARSSSVAEVTAALPGFELQESLRTRSFWMICVVQVLYGAIGAGSALHLITYLIGLGYSATFAAGVQSLVLAFAALGKLGMGVVSDRVSARRALVLNWVAMGSGMILIFGAASPVLLVPFVLVYGLSLGAPLVLVPLLQAEALGLKRFGSIGGITALCQTIGSALGPIVVGRIFDVTGSYGLAFQTFALMSVAGLIATMMCLNFQTEQARLTPVSATAA